MDPTLHKQAAFPSATHHPDTDAMMKAVLACALLATLVVVAPATSDKIIAPPSDVSATDQSDLHP